MRFSLACQEDLLHNAIILFAIIFFENGVASRVRLKFGIAGSLSNIEVSSAVR